MLVLRTAHSRARSDPTFIEPDPRKEMRLLADAFPGVLREIDTLPMEEIERRILALTNAETNLTLREPWMDAVAIFHRLARGALETKRWLRGRKRVTSKARDEFHESCSVEARAFEDDLEQIANPPRGRLMDFVITKLASMLDRTEAETRALVFFR